jgi:hypothetical protein
VLQHDSVGWRGSGILQFAVVQIFALNGPSEPHPRMFGRLRFGSSTVYPHRGRMN